MNPVRWRSDERGVTLTEMTVMLLIMSIVVSVFYAFLAGGQRLSRDGRDRLESNQTARLLLERLARELRETDRIVRVNKTGEDTEIEFQVDLNEDGAYVDGYYETNITDDERLKYRHQSATRRVLLNTKASGAAEALATNIVSFSLMYFGNNPILDCGLEPPVCESDGVVTWQEVDLSPQFFIWGYGNDNGDLDAELDHVTSIEAAVKVGTRPQSYRTRVELRNLFR